MEQAQVLSRPRNRTVDCLRLLAAFSVICLHAFSGRGVWLSEEIAAFSRYAVPLFFLFSGYFAARYDRPRLLRQIRKILLVCIAANLLYLALDLLAYPSWAQMSYRLGELYTPQHWLWFLAFNEPPVSAHLWFLGAMLYVLLLELVFSPLIKKTRHPARWTFAVAAVLFFGGLIFYDWCRTTMGEAFPLCAYRNFLFLGLPFFLGGKLLRWKGHLLPSLPGWGAALVIVALLGLTWLEFSLVGVKETYLSQSLLAGVLARLAFRCPAPQAPRAVCLLAWLGRHCALPIYVVHVYILGLVEGNYYRHHPWQYELSTFHLNALITFALSLGVALVFAAVKLGFLRLRDRRRARKAAA